MMKKIFLTVILFAAATVVSNAFGQDLSKFNLYNPKEDAKAKIEKAVKQAKKQGKHVLIEIGGTENDLR